MIQTDALAGNSGAASQGPSVSALLCESSRSRLLVRWSAGHTLLAALSSGCHQPLLVAPIGAPTVLLFGQPGSPLAQPRNIIAGNTLAATVSVLCVATLGHAP